MNDFFSDDFAFVHTNYSQLRRIQKIKSTKMLKIDCEKQTAVFLGSEGSIHETSLEACTCSDFSSSRLPCKHIYSLASKLGIFTPAEIPFFDAVENLTASELKELVLILYGCENKCPKENKTVKKLVRLGFCESAEDENDRNIIIVKKSDK